MWLNPVGKDAETPGEAVFEATAQQPIQRWTLAEYRGRADVIDGRGQKVDDVQVTVRGMVHHSASRGVLTTETLAGWRRFHMARQREYVMRLADGRQVEIVVDRVSVRPGGDIAITCPRGLPKSPDEDRRRARLS